MTATKSIHEIIADAALARWDGSVPVDLRRVCADHGVELQVIPAEKGIAAYGDRRITVNAALPEPTARLVVANALALIIARRTKERRRSLGDGWMGEAETLPNPDPRSAGSRIVAPDQAIRDLGAEHGRDAEKIAAALRISVLLADGRIRMVLGAEDA